MFRIGLIFSLIFLMQGCSTIVSATTGNKGVQEDRGRRTMGSMLDDGIFETAIKVNIDAADDALKSSHINVVSFNAVVLLVGQVPSQDLKNLATRVATSTNTRVKTVHNELEVAGATTFLSRSNDAWLSSKLKTLMLADPTVSGMRTKVVTENGVVYLMGLLTQEEANQAVELVSNSGGVTKVVRAFEYTD